MTDIMADWKNSRFIVVPALNFVGAPVSEESCYMVILTDISFWVDNGQALSKWCKQHNATEQGMTVTLPDSETKTLFYLRWL